MEVDEVINLAAEIDNIGYTIGVCCANMLDRFALLEGLMGPADIIISNQTLTRLKTEHPEYADFYDRLFSIDSSLYIGGENGN